MTGFKGHFIFLNIFIILFFRCTSVTKDIFFCYIRGLLIVLGNMHSVVSIVIKVAALKYHRDLDLKVNVQPVRCNGFVMNKEMIIGPRRF